MYKRQIPAYATLPLDPAFAHLCDMGKVEEYDVDHKLDTIIEQIELAAKQADEKKAAEKAASANADAAGAADEKAADTANAAASTNAGADAAQGSAPEQH